MSTQPNLDYFVRAPTRQEVAHARLTGKRGDMYAWRSDARHPVFDPITGARCKQRHLFNPQPTQHVARRRGSAEDSSSCSSGSEDESDGDDDAAALVWPSAGGNAGDRRRRWKQTNFAFHPDHFKRRGSGRESGMHSAVNDGGSGTYVPYLHDTILLCRPPEPAQREANDSPDAAARTGHGRRTSVVLAVTYNNAEAGTRAVQIAEEAKNGELLSMSSLSPAPRQQPQQQRKKSYAYASSPTHCFDEGAAVSAAAAAVAVTAAAGAMRSSITGAPYAAVDGGARPYTASFDDDMSTPGDTKLKATPVDPASAGHHKRAATAPSTGAAWCATVGPTLAGRQRVLAMAEGVYRDLVSGDAQHRTTLPTCELAYSLRASYTSGSHHRVSSSGSTRARAEKAVAGSSRTHLPRSATCTTTASLPSRIAGESSSLLGRSSAVPTAASPIHRGAHPVSKQRPVSANTAMGSSVIQGSSLYEKGPHRRTVTAVGPNGLAGSSFFEEVHEEASGNDEGTPPLPAAPALVREVPAVAVSAAGRRTSAARPSPPPSLHPQVVRPFTSDHSMTSSLDAVSRTVSAASPLGCDGATAAGSAHLTAPPTLSQFDLELQLTESVNGIAYRSTCKSSPMARESGGRRSSHMTITPKSETARWQQRRSTHDSHDDNAAGTATSRGVSSATEKNRKKKSRGSSKQRRGHRSRSRSRSGHHQHRQHSAGAAAALRAASGDSQRGHSATQSTHKTNNTTSGADGSSGTLRLPSSAKETRVYAVRVRTVFTNADASPAASRQWREPPRHGVPVLLPNDWQLHS